MTRDSGLSPVALLYAVISGFVAAVVFSHSEPYGVWEEAVTAKIAASVIDFNQILHNLKDQQVLVVRCTQGAKSAIYDCLVVIVVVIIIVQLFLLKY